MNIAHVGVRLEAAGAPERVREPHAGDERDAAGRPDVALNGHSPGQTFRDLEHAYDIATLERFGGSVAGDEQVGGNGNETPVRTGSLALRRRQDAVDLYRAPICGHGEATGHLDQRSKRLTGLELVCPRTHDGAGDPNL